MKKSKSRSWRRGERVCCSGHSSGCSSAVLVALGSRRSSSSLGTTDSARSSFNQYIGSSSCNNNSSNTLLLFSSTFLFASCANLSKNVAAFTGLLSSSSSKSTRRGSSAGPTDTKAPNSESELACFVWCLWYNDGTEEEEGWEGFRGIVAPRIGEARGVLGEKRVENLSMYCSVSRVVVIVCWRYCGRGNCMIQM